MQSYKCNKCGAEIIINNDISFTKCLYCGNSIAIVKDNEKKLNIKEIIPFTIDKEDAIKYFKKYYGEEVLDAKKVYVPVRFCNYEFDYLIDYNYYVEIDSDNGTRYIHYNQEDLIDGYMENEVIFGDTKVNKVLFEGLFDEVKDDRLKFDYAVLKDVSIECSNLDEEENIKERLLKKVRTFSVSEIYRFCKSGGISEIYSENYFISDVYLEDFSTLIPIYIVKNESGIIYNMPGTKKIYNIVNKKRAIDLIRKIIVVSIMPTIITIFLAFYYLMASNQNDEYEFNYFDSNKPIMIASFIVWLILIFIIYYSMRKKSTETVDRNVNNDYKYKRHVLSHVKEK